MQFLRNRTLIILVVIGFLILFWAFMVRWGLDLYLFRNDPEIQAARRQKELDDLTWYAILFRWWWLGVAIVLIALPTIVVLSNSWATIQKATVYTVKLGKNIEIPISLKQIRQGFLAHIYTMLANAINLKALYPRWARDMLVKIFQLHARQVQRYLPQDLPEMLSPSLSVPTFAELLHEGRIAPGQPLTFGFTKEGTPKTGTWEHDLHSNATGGESGSGKTNTERFLVAQTLLCLPLTHFWVLDFHFPHSEGLLMSLGHLKEFVTYPESDFEVQRILEEVKTTITRRKHGQEASYPLKILVVDEVLEGIRKNPMLSMVMELISTEGRKFGIFSLTSSQTWKADKIGGSSVRDTTNSLFCHRIKKPNAARMLVQDREYAKMVRHLADGQALFEPVHGDVEILSIPYCAPVDMQHVSRIVQTQQLQFTPKAPPKKLAMSDPEIDEFFEEIVHEKEEEHVLTSELCKMTRKAQNLSQAELADMTCGVCTQMDVSRFEQDQNIHQTKVAALKKALFAAKQTSV